VGDGYDLIVRIDPSSDERLVGRRFLNDERLIVAYPDPPRPPTLAKADDTSVNTDFATTTPPDVIWQFQTDKASENALRPGPVLRLSSLSIVRDAVPVGAGACPLRRQ
jgi:DNA-binding transcriptional LysR family regulator